MGKSREIIAGAIIALALWGCGGQQTTEAPEQVAEEPRHKSVSNELRLNEGEKWVANPETDEGMRKLLEMINVFKGQNQETRTFTGLGQNMMPVTDEIISKCTMTGEAHDQLHLVLVPIIEHIEAMAMGRGNGDNHLKSLEQVLTQGYFEHFRVDG